MSTQVQWKSLATLCVAAMLATVGASAADKAASDAIPNALSKTSTEPAHVEVQRAFDSLLAANQELKRAVDENDLAAFRTQATRVREQLASSRLDMDRAFLTGSWKSPQQKRDAADLINRMQGAEILSLMTVAITAYDFPAKKIPAGATDAAKRLGERIEQLAASVRALNANAG
jgi:hypothetical protein